MRPALVEYYPSCAIEPFEDCPVAQATNDVLSYTYKIPGVGYVYRYSNNGGDWTTGPLYLKRDHYARGEEVCIGKLVKRTPDEFLEKIMPTYMKMAEIIGS
jgi:hypothetical protein